LRRIRSKRDGENSGAQRLLKTIASGDARTLIRCARPAEKLEKRPFLSHDDRCSEGRPACRQLDDGSCDAQLAGFLREEKASNTRQGARAYGTEMHPSNLIRVMPAQGRNEYRFPHREDPKAIASDEGNGA
jgi:hypothetical protein